MPSFLEKLLSLTKYTTNSYKQDFLPRRLGLGYELRAKRIDKSVIRPVLERSRKKMKIEKNEEESEEVSKIKYIEKKRKKT